MISSEKDLKVVEAKELEVNDFILTENGYKKIKSIKSCGEENCYDISLLFHDDLFANEENFVLSNGIISHNCSLSIVDGCVKFIEQTRGKKYARKDIPINDKESIFNSSMTDLVGIFQFENASTKEITDLVKMESLNDITAVTSLIRPGPRNMGMDRQYAINKNEGYVSNYPESISKHLEETHGILTYQEEIMLISQDFAGFSPIESNQLRSVLAKKKADKVPYYREKFIKGAMANADKHGMSEKEVSDFFSLIESFAEYGFNKCTKKDTPIETIDGRICKIKDIQIGEYIKAPCIKNVFKYVKVIDKIDTGIKDCYEFETESGKKVTCTIDHKFNCEDGITRKLEEIIKENHRIKCDE